jgi:hypothetical protein
MTPTPDDGRNATDHEALAAARRAASPMLNRTLALMAAAGGAILGGVVIAEGLSLKLAEPTTAVAFVLAVVALFTPALFGEGLAALVEDATQVVAIVAALLLLNFSIDSDASTEVLWSTVLLSFAVSFRALVRHVERQDAAAQQQTREERIATLEARIATLEEATKQSPSDDVEQP